MFSVILNASQLIPINRQKDQCCNRVPFVYEIQCQKGVTPTTLLWGGGGGDVWAADNIDMLSD
jgi:hypothetical protein